MKKWIDTFHCRSRAHCRLCRNPQQRQVRAKWAERYDLPGGEIDFTCPFGVPWRTIKPPKRPPIEAPAYVARRRACEECSGEVKEACFIAHQSACSQRRILADPSKECPAGRWSP